MGGPTALWLFGSREQLQKSQNQRLLIDIPKIPSPRKKQKDPPAPGWMPPTMHYHIFVLHDPELLQPILKEFKSSSTGNMLRVWNKSSTYSTIYTFGTISNNTDINTTEKALLPLVTPSHWKSLVQLETPSPFSDPLSSSHVAFIVLSLCQSP